ncbi:MAG: hypothetical protein ABIJ34_08030 [archaeon]
MAQSVQPPSPIVESYEANARTNKLDAPVRQRNMVFTIGGLLIVAGALYIFRDSPPVKLIGSILYRIISPPSPLDMKHNFVPSMITPYTEYFQVAATVYMSKAIHLIQPVADIATSHTSDLSTLL